HHRHRHHVDLGGASGHGGRGRRGLVRLGVRLRDRRHTDTGAGVLVTTDGGTSWVPETVPAAITQLSGVSCPTTSDCVAVSYSGDDAFELTWAATPLAVDSVTCAKVTGTLSSSFEVVVTFSKCSPTGKGDKSATIEGPATALSGTITWTSSGWTTVTSLTFATTSPGRCTPGSTEYDVSGSVIGGTSPITKVGDPVSLPTCVSPTDRITLVPSTVALL
ncbi:MAG: hypothetical protein ACLQPH_04270, partial [Acidimicrobiales bacterium]